MLQYNHLKWSLKVHFILKVSKMEKLISLEKYRIIEPARQSQERISSVAKYHNNPVRTIQHCKTNFSQISYPLVG